MNTETTYRYSERGLSRAGFFNQVYAWMCVGLALTGVIALAASMSPSILAAIMKPAAMWGIIILQLILVFVVGAAIESISAGVATVLYLLYAALNGLMLSSIFLIYAKATIATTFFITAGTFGACSLYGFVTKKDLSTIGSICIMALFGLIIAMIVNIFVANTAMDWIINIAGVLIFVGLTAWDTQKIKDLADSEYADDRIAIVGSLALYLDFLNLFLFILRIFGGKGGK
jgi:FtsH-binding integral membrane protein